MTALDDEPRDLDVHPPTLVAGARAILRDFTGVDYGMSDTMAFAAMALGGLDERSTLAITVGAAVVRRFVDAAGRV